jgi:excinuclease UvrABC helicase subunit UvrB
LSRHKKTCNKQSNSLNDPDKTVNTILELVKENQQFKNMLIEQNNHILKITNFIEKLELADLEKIPDIGYVDGCENKK